MTGATGLSPEIGSAVRDLILVLADTKRLLGFRYAEWMLGAPELETGIACSSMAQDEWGHARLLYALLKGFDEDVEALEHGRDRDAYRNMEVLDAPAATWPDAVALMVIADTAITTQLEVLQDSGYEPLSQRVAKLVEEERFHAAHGMAWTKRLANGGPAARSALAEAVGGILSPVLLWFGPDSERAASLTEAEIAAAAGDALRARFLGRIKPVLALADVATPQALDFAGFDEASRRSAAGGPDEATIRKIRGDRNRAFLMD
jgi:ring-1,2-phenylacetyl-CoA epoxidase subunit PaaC